MVDLGRGEALEVHVGQRLVQRADEIEVVVERQVRVLAADHVDLAELLRLVHLERVLHEVADVVQVGAVLLARARERAELALHAADVRVVQVQVVDEEDLVGASAQAASGVGEPPDGEDVVALEQRDAVVEVEPLAGEHLLLDCAECARTVDRCHISGRPSRVF